MCVALQLVIEGSEVFRGSRPLGESPTWRLNGWAWRQKLGRRPVDRGAGQLNVQTGEWRDVRWLGALIALLEDSGLVPIAIHNSL